MNKTDTILIVQRLHEAIRKLPNDVEIHGFQTRYDRLTSDGSYTRYLEIHLSEPIEWPAIFDGRRYSSWQEKRICVTPFAYAWWSEDIPEVEENE